jgi:hypothetical protein
MNILVNEFQDYLQKRILNNNLNKMVIEFA